MTIPFDHVPLPEQREWVEELVDLGYTDVWSSEANGADAFTPLALASVWAPSLRLGTAIEVFTKPDRVVLGARRPRDREAVQQRGHDDAAAKFVDGRFEHREL